VTEIPADIAEELATLLDEADTRLGLSTRESEPDEIQQRIPEHLTATGSTDEAMALGAAWGEATRRALGWEWIWLDDVETLGVAPSDRRYLVMPLHFLMTNVTGEVDQRNTLLLFNMLKAGSLPEASPEQLFRLG
jgi:hypothetical protein